MSSFDKLRREKLLSFTLVVLTLCVGVVIGTVINVNWGVKAAAGGQVAPGASPLVTRAPSLHSSVRLPSTWFQFSGPMPRFQVRGMEEASVVQVA